MGIESALIGGGAMLGGALIGSEAAEDAAHAQSQAAAGGIAENRRQFDLTRQDQAPWLEVGGQSIRTIGDLLRTGEIFPGFTGANLVTEPGYQFRLGEGMKGLENAARARGMYMSPSTVKGLLRYNQDYASGEFQNAFNRDMQNKTTKFNMLSGAAGSGQVAANAIAGAGANSAKNIGELMMGSANARGAAGIAGANAWTNALAQGANMYNQNRMLDRIGYGYGGGGPVNWGATGDYPVGLA